jgi:hypothetical protein
MSSPNRTLQWARTPDGRALCFHEYGDPAGRPVFFMQGGPGCRLLSTTQRRLGYDELIAELGVRLIRHDRPGFGRFDRHRGRRMTDTAADVATIADVLGIGQFAVVGGVWRHRPRARHGREVARAGQPGGGNGARRSLRGGRARRLHGRDERAGPGLFRSNQERRRRDGPTSEPRTRSCGLGHPPTNRTRRGSSRRHARGWGAGSMTRSRTQALGASTWIRSVGRRRSGTTRTTRPSRSSTQNGSPRTSRAPSSS